MTNHPAHQVTDVKCVNFGGQPASGLNFPQFSLNLLSAYLVLSLFLLLAGSPNLRFAEMMPHVFPLCEL